jgi:hypothetical protein
MPNILNIKCPNKQNVVIMINATKTALNANFLITLSSESPTIEIKTGVFPIGFNMAKKPKKTVVRKRLKSCIVSDVLEMQN